MTTKAKAPDTPPPADPPVEPETVADPPAEVVAEPTKVTVPEGMCAVDDGSAHYGSGAAIPGTAVCSAHEVNYHRDGSLRRP